MCSPPLPEWGECKKQGDYSEMHRKKRPAICGIITFLLHLSLRLLLLLFCSAQHHCIKLCDIEETLHLSKPLLEM